MRHKRSITAAAACLAAAALAVGLAGCGDSGEGGGAKSSPKAKPATKVVNVAEVEQAPSQSVHVGDVIDVTLPSNASTGYAWTAVLDEDGVIEQVGEPTTTSGGDGDVVGAPGTTTISLKAVKEGAALVTFKEMPPGDQDTPGSVSTMYIEVVAGSSANHVSVNQDYVSHSAMMNVGDTLQVALAQNTGSTGYAWKLESVSSASLKSLGAPKTESDTSGAVGAGGTSVFSFKGAAAGEATLVFSLRAPGNNRIAGVWATTAQVLPTAKPVEVVVDTVTAKKGTVTDVMQGDTLYVKLDGRPSDGYAWDMQVTPEGALEQQGDPVFKAKSDLMGSGGKLVYTYVVKDAGEIALDAAYGPVEDPTTDPTREYTFKFESAAEHKPAVVTVAGSKSCPPVAINKGDKLNVHLHGATTSPYNWVVSSIDDGVLKQTGKAGFKQTGSDGTGVVTIPFQSVAAGGTNVVLLHAAQGKAPEATFAFRAVVSGKTSHKTMDVTVKETPQTVDMKVGDTLEVNIPGNATTGYQWVDATPDNMIMVQDGDPTYKADDTGMVGSGGTYTLKWSAAGPGGELVMAELMPPGDQSGAPAAVWSIWVNVKK